MCKTIKKGGVLLMTTSITKVICTAVGGLFGWFVAEFRPTFPLAVVAIIFIVYDAWTAYQLDVRVHATYPDKVLRAKAHFTSFAFGKVIRETIPSRLMFIFLAYLVEHWVFIHATIPLSYVMTGCICAEQFVSICENNASCQPDKDSRFWRMMKRIFIDKTSRHLDIAMDELTEGTDEKA